MEKFYSGNLLKKGQDRLLKLVQRRLPLVHDNINLLDFDSNLTSYVLCISKQQLKKCRQEKKIWISPAVGNRFSYPVCEMARILLLEDHPMFAGLIRSADYFNAHSRQQLVKGSTAYLPTVQPPLAAPPIT